MTSSPTQLIDSAMPIVQPVHRAWGKLSWDLSETTWKSNGGTERWQSWGGSGVMPRAKRSPAEDRGDAMAIIERLHRRVGRSAMCR